MPSQNQIRFNAKSPFARLCLDERVINGRAFDKWAFDKLGFAKSLAVAAMVFLTVSIASNRSVLADEGPLVTVEFDFETFHESTLGKSLIDAGAKLAAEQMDKDPDEAMSALIESLGFDPMKQEMRLSLSVSDLEDPLTALTVDLQLNDSSGNLEGLLLAAPGDAESELAGQKMHSVAMDGQTFHIAFCDDAGGRKLVIAAPSRKIVASAVKAASTGSPSDRSGDGEMMLICLHRMPEEISDVPPVANIAGMIEGSNLSMKQEGDDLILSINLTAESEERAKQLQQLIQGVVAMVGLFKDEIQSELSGEEVASAIIPVLDQLDVQRDEKKVSVVAAIPESLIMDFLREEAGLPL